MVTGRARSSSMFVTSDRLRICTEPSDVSISPSGRSYCPPESASTSSSVAFSRPPYGVMVMRSAGAPSVSTLPTPLTESSLPANSLATSPAYSTPPVCASRESVTYSVAVAVPPTSTADTVTSPQPSGRLARSARSRTVAVSSSMSAP